MVVGRGVLDANPDGYLVEERIRPLLGEVGAHPEHELVASGGERLACEERIVGAAVGVRAGASDPAPLGLERVHLHLHTGRPTAPEEV